MTEGAPQALEGAYLLLAECIEGPLTDSVLTGASSSPLLADALDGYQGQMDDLAADHYHAFCWALTPRQGVFLDAGGWADGSSDAKLRSLYGEIGFSPSSSAVSADHLATLCRALAWACKDERQSAQLLDEHLLRWLPCFAEAVRRLERPFPMAVIDQLTALVALHAEQLGRAADDGAPAFELPAVAVSLADPQTGLRDIATYLSSPSRCGLALSRQDVARIARDAGCHRGFGDRSSELTNCFRSAAHGGRLDVLVEGLISAFSLPLAGVGVPQGLLLPWQVRRTETVELLVALVAADTTVSSLVG